MMKNYLEYPTPLLGTDFAWSSQQAYAGGFPEKTDFSGKITRRK
jgi:hypothetical protein